MWSILIFAIAQAAIDCSEYTAVKVVFVLDKSGSTFGSHYENQVKVANAILKTFRNMTQHLHWGTITFASVASVELDMKVDDASRTIVAGSQFPIGGTHYKPALTEAKKMILQYSQTMPKKVTSVKAYIVLLTDGEPSDINTQEEMASFRNTVVKNTTIDIASAFLSSRLNNKALNLLKALSCSNVTSPDCDDHVIQRTLNSANVAQVNDDVTKLVGKLVDEKTCGEPPIAPNPVTTSVASNATEISGTTNSDQPKEDTSLSLLYVAAIALAVVAAIIMCLCCLVVARPKAPNVVASKQLDTNGKHTGVRTNHKINRQKRTHQKIYRRKDEHIDARSKHANH